MYEDLYDAQNFPIFQYYIGDASHYLVFLVLRFYDNTEDFATKLRSVFPNIRVRTIRRKPKLWEKVYIVKNTFNGQIVELSKKDDPFTTAIKLFRVIAGPEWLQIPEFYRAFEEILPRILWSKIPLIPHYGT